MNDRHATLDRLFDVLDCLVHERVGIIRHLIEVKREAGAPDFFAFYARACDTSAFCGQRNFSDAGGASTDRRIAMAKAVGEAVERYCAAFYYPEELPLCSFDSAPFRCIQPDRFALYSERQYYQAGFPYVAFTNATPVRWTPGVDLTSGQTFHLPAAMVFIPYVYVQRSGEPPIAQSISTGAACHCSMAEAAIGAICEVIERDAFTITWQAQLAMPQIMSETLSELNQDLVGRLEETGASVVVLNITMDHGIPTILSVLRSDSPEAPGLVFAAATHLNPELAVRKSLEELAHTRRMAQELKMTRPPFVPEPGFENVVTQTCHVLLYCDQKNSGLADFLFASEKRVSFDDIPNISRGNPDSDLDTLVHGLAVLNYQVLVVDLTTSDIRDLGLHVVRAIIPGFHPLFFGHNVRALGGDRLWQVPQKLGHRGITAESGDNPAPHPYP